MHMTCNDLDNDTQKNNFEFSNVTITGSLIVTTFFGYITINLSGIKRKSRIFGVIEKRFK